ncbi:sulfonate ABC transporter substrate-binding protein [Noviherbaspirillum aridicola]|uniref:Sulfonate ABC transporter substrate-binding protein n=1 Tax=Noviherbaspirillum aridicola TaxID=2849687 RepID=A0ABQ4Q0K4_9BURK|nr:sulfonate ABC transporter substrate-binding protein [Noviherbaspirillum aridicola]GIZ50634.1 sulfonate ABC transporter substrate-binding protein [Noviherbaspirillum aridicola]
MSNFDDKRQGRRRTLGILSAAALGALASGLSTAASAQQKGGLRIGYQKYGTLTILKARGNLEKRFAAQGIDVRWTEFPSGPALLEALNVGSVDYGTVGEAPPIFAQAAGANLVYVANEPPAPASEAIVVPKDSALKSVAELRGRKVALNKGSNVHYLLVKALERAGVAYKDVNVVYLPPSDARAAFERGSVDAWVIWDPFLAAAEKQLGARILADGQGLVANHQFFLASRPYAEKNPDVIKAIQDELVAVDEWSRRNVKEVAAILSQQIGLPADIVELAAARYSYGAQPVSDAVLAEQQKIADVFASLKLIPKKIDVRAATLQSRA